MKHILAIVLGSALVLAGCATKKYVQTQVDPVNKKVDQVNSSLGDTQKQLSTDETKLSATAEKAEGADSRATDALGRADAASKKADQVRSDLRSELSQTVANLDDYKAVANATVHFKFNSDKLGDDDKQQLDQLAQQMGTMKRYFIAIEGFTDKVGAPEYNLDLSRRRAQAVQTYLVVQHNVPVYRLQIVGLGKDKPADEGKGREARAKNRRVEVTVFNADVTVGAGAAQGASSAQQQPR